MHKKESIYTNNKGEKFVCLFDRAHLLNYLSDLKIFLAFDRPILEECLNITLLPNRAEQ